MKKSVLLFVVILLCSSLSAQRRGEFSFGRPHGKPANTVIKYKMEYLYGSILDHSEKVSPLIDNNIRGAEFAVELPKYGGKPWNFYYAFPTVGFALSYIDLGNSEMLGKAVSFYPYMNIPLFQTQTFFFNFKFGGGISYLTKKYDSSGPDSYELNNFAIGSNLNVVLTTGLNAELLLSKRQNSFFSHFSLTAGGGLLHFSNGSVMKPNTGLNVLHVSGGIKYIPHLHPTPLRSGLSRMPRKWSLEPVMAVGVNEQHVSDPKKYLNASLSVGIYRPLTNAYRVGLNADAFYNAAFLKERIDPDYYAGEDSKFRAGLSLANELMFGDFTAGIHIGAYVMNKIEHDGRFYFKLRAKYRVYDNFFLTATVKTHKQVAENMEIGVGYSLMKKDKPAYAPEKYQKNPNKKKKSFFFFNKKDKKTE